MMAANLSSQLLVSVRSAEEASVAMAGGVDLIDIKEPGNGSLGKADDDTIDRIVKICAGRIPVSLALGELVEWMGHSNPNSIKFLEDNPKKATISFLKWGLSGLANSDWKNLLARTTVAISANSPAQVVVVAYADWISCAAPPVDDVVEFACKKPGSVFLLDTWGKNQGVNLLNFLSQDHLSAIVERCRNHQVKIALAGSLGPSEIIQVQALRPDWFAVRGAVCARGRESAINLEKVQQLAALVHGTRETATYAS